MTGWLETDRGKPLIWTSNVHSCVRHFASSGLSLSASRTDCPSPQSHAMGSIAKMRTTTHVKVYNIPADLQFDFPSQAVQWICIKLLYTRKFWTGLQLRLGAMTPSFRSIIGCIGSASRNGQDQARDIRVNTGLIGHQYSLTVSFESTPRIGCIAANADNDSGAGIR